MRKLVDKLKEFLDDPDRGCYGLELNELHVEEVVNAFEKLEELKQWATEPSGIKDIQHRAGYNGQIVAYRDRGGRLVILEDKLKSLLQEVE